MSDILHALERAARACGDHAKELRLRGLKPEDVETKKAAAGADIVTAADKEGQAMAKESLSQDLPDEEVIGEEDTNRISTTIPANCTVLDPIDGTANYLSGEFFPAWAGREWGTTLCTLRNGLPEHGVIYFPVDGLLFTASRGQGCYVNGRRLPSFAEANYARRPRERTFFSLDLGPWGIAPPAATITDQERQMQKSLFAAIYGARTILLGEAGCYYNYGVAKIWDVAAGALMVEECGGVVCDLAGGWLQFNRRDMDWIYAWNWDYAHNLIPHTRNLPTKRKK